MDMKYLDISKYNKQNLKKEDREELDRCRELIDRSVDRALYAYDCDTWSKTINKALKEVVDTFSREVKSKSRGVLQNELGRRIDSYGDDVEIKEVECPDTYLDDEDEEEDDKRL